MRVLLIDLDGKNGGAEKILSDVYRVYNDEKHLCEFLAPLNSYFDRNIIGIKRFTWSYKILYKNYDIIIYNNKKSLKYLLLFKFIFFTSRHIYYSHGYLSRVQSFGYFLIEPLLTKSVFVSKSLYDSYWGSKKLLIYNSISLNKTEKINSNNDIREVFMWAQLRSWKGHLMLIDAFKELWNNGIDIRLNLVYTTSSAESGELLSRIRACVSEGKYPRLILHEDVDSHLDLVAKNADLAISSSTQNDPFPTVILEAFSMKIPIIASAVGGCLEMLMFDKRLLFEPTKDHLVEAVEQFINLDRGEIDSIIRANYDRLITNYSYESFRLKILENL